MVNKRRRNKWLFTATIRKVRKIRKILKKTRTKFSNFFLLEWTFLFCVFFFLSVRFHCSVCNKKRKKLVTQISHTTHFHLYVYLYNLYRIVLARIFEVDGNFGMTLQKHNCSFTLNARDFTSYCDDNYNPLSFMLWWWLQTRITQPL